MADRVEFDPSAWPPPPTARVRRQLAGSLMALGVGTSAVAGAFLYFATDPARPSIMRMFESAGAGILIWIALGSTALFVSLARG